MSEKILVPIDLDHQQFLGNTITKIATDKAGILKPGCPAVSARQGEEAHAALVAEADAVHAPPAPFLCFQRRTPGDLLIGGAKVLGSAQRRRKTAVLQHGGLLLAQSAHAPELAGIAELTGRELEPGDRRLLEEFIAEHRGVAAAAEQSRDWSE